jgi:hypothetical protein
VRYRKKVDSRQVNGSFAFFAPDGAKMLSRYGHLLTEAI